MVVGDMLTLDKARDPDPLFTPPPMVLYTTIPLYQHPDPAEGVQDLTMTHLHMTLPPPLQLPLLVRSMATNPVRNEVGRSFTQISISKQRSICFLLKRSMVEI